MLFVYLYFTPDTVVVCPALSPGSPVVDGAITEILQEATIASLDLALTHTVVSTFFLSPWIVTVCEFAGFVLVPETIFATVGSSIVHTNSSFAYSLNDALNIHICFHHMC